jgi:hypothetical protein
MSDAITTSGSVASTRGRDCTLTGRCSPVGGRAGRIVTSSTAHDALIEDVVKS